MKKTRRICRLVVKNYRSIEALDITVPERGLLISGRSKVGKSSIILAVRECLEIAGVSPDAITNGTDRSEILVDLGDITARKLMPRDGTPTTTVTPNEGPKVPLAKPKSMLAELIGQTLDPMALYRAEPKAARAMVLAALPVTVTREQLARWCPDVPADFDVTGHGLVVASRLHDRKYAERTAANAREKAARAEAERLAAEAEKHAAPADAPSEAEAVRVHGEAVARLASLRTQDQQAQAAIERTAGTRATIAKLRADAAAQPIGDEAEGRAAVDEARAEVAALERKLQDARNLLASMEASLRGVVEANRRAEALRGQADALESALATAGPEPVAAETFDEAQVAVRAAEDALEQARSASAARVARETAAAARAAHETAKAEADRLDVIVRALADDAPRVLIESSGGIRGLGIKADDIALDGVTMAGLSGMERLEFAVNVAKRANEGRGLHTLVIDGLEAIDDDAIWGFLERVTSDGWQVLGTRVSCTGANKGELEVIALEGAAEAA